MIYILLYLVAIVLANLSVYYFGVTFVIVNAFLFIGLDLTARDKLHDVWEHSGLFWKMLLLVLSGSIISFLFSFGAWQIALASFVSFFFAGMIDTLFYKLLSKQKRLIKINGSNIPSALTDSILFPTLAFGVFIPGVIVGQFLAKVFGGFIWSIVLTKFSKQ